MHVTGNGNQLSIATYNLENLDPGDGKYDILASDIIYNLGAPDIIAVQEVQDADGAGGGANLSGTVTAQGLIDAIFAASGKTYAYVEVAPATANSTGGEPNGNIRNGYFYNVDRVDPIAGSAALITGAAYAGSRSPLVAGWTFAGETLYTVNVHFTSRGGSDPLWGDAQPPNDAGDSQRTAQAAGVKAWINDQLATDPGLNIAVLGDWNGFDFEAAQTQLTDPLQGGVMTDLNTLLVAAERYSYLFEGNAQQLDHILVTGGLLAGAQYDAVHLNALFTGARPTDHDPQVALLMLGTAPSDLALDNASVDENLAAGTLVGTLSASDTANDTLSFTLVDDAGGLFAVDAATGAITTKATLDFEAQSSYTIEAKVTDTGGLSATRSFTITVGDVREPTLGTPDADAMTGTAGDDWLAGLGGNDTLAGLDGNDRLDGGSGADSLVGGAGDDTFVVDSLADKVIEGAGAGVDTVETDLASYSLVRLGNVENLTYTGAGAATLTGNNAANVLTGGGMDDVLSGSGGNDTLVGNAGNDTLAGGAGADSLDGGDGDDVFQVGTGGGVDAFLGGTGHDRIVATANLAQIRYSQMQDIEAIDGAGFAGVRVLGGTGADVMDFGAMTLTGIAAIDGGAGNDVITGTAQADVLFGGTGQDVLEGGFGADVFAYALTVQSTRTASDRIVDFVRGEDLIDLSAIDGDGAGGSNAFHWIGGAAFGGTAGELRFEQVGGDTIIYGDTNGDMVADIRIELTGLLALDATDFML